MNAICQSYQEYWPDQKCIFLVAALNVFSKLTQYSCVILITATRCSTALQMQM